MKAQQLSPGYWQVTEGHKWYTVQFRAPLKPHIENHKCIIVQADGDLGRRILHAIKKVNSPTNKDLRT